MSCDTNPLPAQHLPRPLRVYHGELVGSQKNSHTWDARVPCCAVISPVSLPKTAVWSASICEMVTGYFVRLQRGS